MRAGVHADAAPATPVQIRATPDSGIRISDLDLARTGWDQQIRRNLQICKAATGKPNRAGLFVKRGAEQSLERSLSKQVAMQMSEPTLTKTTTTTTTTGDLVAARFR